MKWINYIALLAISLLIISCGKKNDDQLNLKGDSIYGYWQPFKFDKSQRYWVYDSDDKSFHQCGSFSINGNDKSGILYTFPIDFSDDCLIPSPIQWRIDDKKGLVFY